MRFVRLPIQLTSASVLIMLATGLMPPATHSRELVISPSDEKTPEIAITVVPSSFDGKVRRGESVDGMLDVFNVGAEPLVLHTEVERVRMSPGSGEMEFGRDASWPGLEQFLMIESRQFQLQPGEAQRVPFRISVPRSAWSGGHYGAVFFSASAVSASSTASRVTQSGRVGSLISLVVEGPADRDGRVSSFTHAGGWSGTTHAFGATYANTGNTDREPLGISAHPSGSVVVRNAVGTTVARTRFAGDTVLPGSERRSSVVVRRGFWFGRYEAELRIRPYPDEKPQVRVVHFWAFSPRGIVAAAGIVLLGVLMTFAVWASRRRRRSQPAS